MKGLSFWQIPTWKKILITSGQAKEVFYYGDNHGTFLLVEIRSIGLGFFGAFSIGVNAVQIGTDWDIFLLHLGKFLNGKGVLFFQIEPTEKSIISGGTQKLYKKFLTPHTRTLDLSLPLDEILSQMHEKGRYNIRLAEKRGVTIERVVFSEEHLDIWMNLLEDTLLRDHFSGNSREYYKNFLLEIEKENIGGLYFAWFEGRVIAAGIFILTLTQAIYYYGVSSSGKEDRKQMAPYLLQWHVIQEAQSRGIEVYDFLGVADPTNLNDSLKGVTDFKEKFGGTRISLPEKYIFVLSSWYYFFKILQDIKNLLKRR